MTIVMVLHDLNHAIMFSDYLVAIKDGAKYGAGAPEKVITSKTLREVFDVEAEIIRHPVLNVPVCLPYGVRGQVFEQINTNTSNGGNASLWLPPLGRFPAVLSCLFIWGYRQAGRPCAKAFRYLLQQGDLWLWR